MFKGIATFWALTAAIAMAACTVHQSDSAPPLTGPSDFAQSIRITSNPDRLTQDGESQSAITIQVFDATGTPSPNVPIRVDMLVNGTLVDFGTLSARNVVTGSDGRASVVYKAPPAPPPSSQVSGTVTIRAIAVGTNAQASNSFTTDIRLVPPGVILAPAGSPTASFTVSPTPVSANVPLIFDASASVPGNGATSITSYAWTFGDGSSASGRTVTKTFTATGAFSVTLTVTNDRGIAASTTQAIPVVGTEAPTAAFVFSPTAPAINQAVNFNATASSAAPGRSIASYSWNYGDGSAAKSGVTSQHDFGLAGTYNVTLVVTDDVGQRSTVTQGVTVSAGAGGGGGQTPPTASFTFSPAAPGVGEIVFFNASTSSAAAGRTIAAYNWTFGDGTVGTGVNPTHAYATAGTYAVQLRVTDNGVPPLSATSAASSITVGSPPAPTANFTFSPASPGRNDQVVFDASSSTTAQGQTIVDVAWNFGDGTAVIHCPGGSVADCPGPTNRISAHTFTTAQTFRVNLVVTDSAGRTGQRTVDITVALAQPNVVISASPTSPAPGATVSFNSNGTTYFAGSGPASFAWTFGDGGSCSTAAPAGCGLGTPANPTHAYAAAGTYSAALSVTDTKGRTGFGTVNVTVAVPTPPAPPVASFTYGPPSPRAAVTPVTFDGNGSTGSNLTYTWNFGDGIIEGPFASATRTHVYQTPGSYPATLRVTDGSTGLSNTSAAQTVTVVP